MMLLRVIKPDERVIVKHGGEHMVISIAPYNKIAGEHPILAIDAPQSFAIGKNTKIGTNYHLDQSEDTRGNR